MNTKANAVFWIGFILILLNWWLSGQSTTFWSAIRAPGPKNQPPINPPLLNLNPFTQGPGGGITIPVIPGAPGIPIQLLSANTSTMGENSGPTGPPVTVKGTKAGTSASAPQTPASSPHGANLPIVAINGTSIPAFSTTQISQGAKAVYFALRDGGLTPTAIAGIMGNIQNEDSSYYIEQHNPDSGGTTSWGLIQWNSGGLGKTPGMQESQLITGNIPKDFNSQIQQIIRIWKTNPNLTGTTPAAVASSWAANVEGCKGCAYGGSQNSARAANATAIYARAMASWEPQWIASTLKSKASGKPAVRSVPGSKFKTGKVNPNAGRGGSIIPAHFLAYFKPIKPKSKEPPPRRPNYIGTKGKVG